MAERTAALSALGMLRDAVQPVHDGHVPVDNNGMPLDERYAVLYASPGMREWEDVGATPTDASHVWQVTSAGRLAQQAIDVAEACTSALVARRLDVDGWTSGLIRQTSTSPVRRQDDLPGDVPVFYIAATYRVSLTRKEGPWPLA